MSKSKTPIEHLQHQKSDMDSNDDDGDINKNLFCDIIAQQQEFQLRQNQLRANQNSANSLSSIRARTRQLELERQLAEERLWRQDSSERIDFAQLERKHQQQDRERPTSSLAAYSSNLNGSGQLSTGDGLKSSVSPPTTGPGNIRRKFSLSYAMSSLTAFTATAMPSSSATANATATATSSGSSGSSAALTGSAGGSAFNFKTNVSSQAQKSHQQQGRLEHQASMISGADLSAARSRLISSYNQHLERQHQLNNNNNNNAPGSVASGRKSALPDPPSETSGPAEHGQERCPSAESKKRGFVHKAIRRGSKMFDSMLLQSAQRQSEQQSEQQHRHQQQQHLIDSDPTSTTSTNNSSSSDQAVPGGPGSHRGVVQFAASPGADNEDYANTNEADEIKPAPWRKRKLTLGSLPSDLRRALSFNTSSQQQNSAAKQQQQLDQASTVAQQSSWKQPTSSSKNSAKNQQQQQQRNPIEQLDQFEQKQQFTAAGNGDNGAMPDGHHQQSSANNNNNNNNNNKQDKPINFKRKNSLFSALSSVNPAQLVKSRSSKTAASEQSQFGLLGQAEQRDRDKFDKIELHRARMQASSQNVSLSLCLDHSRTYKLIIYGSGAVGKTSLIQRFLYGHFPASHKPTVEELHSNKYNIPEVGEIYLEILDTSGTFEFPAMRRLSIEKGDAFILVFSVLDPASWQEVIHLRQMILEHKGESQMSSASTATLTGAAGGAAEAGAKTKAANKAISPRPNSDQPESDQHKPISSIYAAATKLTSMQRRASCVSGHFYSATPPSANAGLPTKNRVTNNLASQQQHQKANQFRAQEKRRMSVSAALASSSQDHHLNQHHQLQLQQQQQLVIGDEDQSSPFNSSLDKAIKSSVCSPSSAHYNSQLSRLIQLAPVCDTTSKLLESGNSLDEQQDNINSMGDRLGDPSIMPGCDQFGGQLTNDRAHGKGSPSFNSNKANGNRETITPPTTTTGSGGINKRGVTKRTVSMAPSAFNNNNKDLDGRESESKSNRNKLFSDLGIFKRTTTPIVVAANKCDFSPEEWKVDLVEAERLVCNEWGHSFVRCSAKEAQNTDRVFKELLRQAQAPANLSESVIDDNQLRRQSLPVLKNQLSVTQMKGLRNLYNMHTGQSQTKPPNSSNSNANYQAKLSSTKQQYQNNRDQISNQSSSDSGQANYQSNEIAATTTKLDRGNMGNRSASSASEDSQCMII